ncbi:hypothetical protein [Catellatospora sp. NPDC049609]|uniref:hypothetical protein n=1 Tax=Catellatospora sp. NPDC049609 TaxID=3155505 RepID=UPI0034324AF3
MVMIITADKPDGGIEMDARSILLVHTPDEGGLCQGCYEFTCTFARFPCSQAQWARAVQDGDLS